MVAGKFLLMWYWSTGKGLGNWSAMPEGEIRESGPKLR